MLLLLNKIIKIMNLSICAFWWIILISIMVNLTCNIKIAPRFQVYSVDLLKHVTIALSSSHFWTNTWRSRRSKRFRRCDGCVCSGFRWIRLKLETLQRASDHQGALITERSAELSWPVMSTSASTANPTRSCSDWQLLRLLPLQRCLNTRYKRCKTEACREHSGRI